MPRYARVCNTNLNVNIIKNTSKMTPETLPNDLQIDHLWHPGTLPGPYGSQASICCSNGDLRIIPGRPFGSPWAPKDTQNTKKYTKHDV